jgi:hypothetical protein
VNWKRPFINLSSTAAFVRRLFALNEGIAAIEVNKIHIDPLPPEQKVGSSNRGGAAAPRNSDPPATAAAGRPESKHARPGAAGATTVTLVQERAEMAGRLILRRKVAR